MSGNLYICMSEKKGWGVVRGQRGGGMFNLKDVAGRYRSSGEQRFSDARCRITFLTCPRHQASDVVNACLCELN